ncbi:hypothetical protein [Corynebacterium amycolatum]|uniref:hypothetical protein n=1 Tax=Corynebacterium amycolatum TaxID=43765 RepID=UPI00191DC3CA|nr:hypothetical protein [Corynebacterium amycolatum]QQU98309.1 hypothetical protein I6I65_02785 [Corynebacterium amycolatum]
MQAKGAKDKRVPGIIDWGFQIIAVILFLVGVFIAFPIPFLTGIYGLFEAKKAEDEYRCRWIIFTLISVFLAIAMFVAWLILSPSGGIEQVPTEQTEWQPVR